MPGINNGPSYNAPGGPGWYANGPRGESYVDENGYIHEWDTSHQNYYNTGRTDNGWLARRDSTGGGGSGSRAGSSGGGDPKRSAAMDALISQINAASYAVPEFATAKLDDSTYDGSSDANAERANFGRAKEQVGLAAQAAVRGLRGVLSTRGQLGSGVEGAGMSRIMSAGANNLGEVSRALAEGRTGREHSFYDNQRARNTQTQQFNVTQLNTRAGMQAQAQQQRLRDLLTATVAS